MNLTDMDLSELKALKKEVDKAISTFEDRQMAQARAELDAHARKLGFTLDHFTGGKKRKTVGVPKYSHPDNPDVTWTGKGRKPAWILEAIERGEDIETFAI